MLEHLKFGGFPEQQTKLAALIAQCADVFALSDEDLGCTDKIQHEIHLDNNVTVTQPYKGVPPTKYKEVREHWTQLLRKGVT